MWNIFSLKISSLPAFIMALKLLPNPDYCLFCPKDNMKEKS